MVLAALMILLGMQVAASDLYARRVSNRVLLSAMVVMAVLHVCGWLFWGRGLPVVFLAGLVLGLISLLPFYAVGWMGAGDVKYFAVIGFALGWQALPPVWLIGSLLAGSHALCVLAPRYNVMLQAQQWQLLVYLDDQPWWRQLARARQGRSGIPYAAYLSVGVIAVCLQAVLQ